MAKKCFDSGYDAIIYILNRGYGKGMPIGPRQVAAGKEIDRIERVVLGEKDKDWKMKKFAEHKYGYPKPICFSYDIRTGTKIFNKPKGGKR